MINSATIVKNRQNSPIYRMVIYINMLKQLTARAKRWGAICLSLAVIIFAMAFMPTQAALVYQNQTPRRLPIYRVAREDKKIAISFDCAWGTEHTDQILAALDKYKVKCTFFAVEFWVEKYPDYVTKIVQRGHEFGTHSKTHSHMAKMDKAAIISELESSSAAIERLTNQQVKLFRAPFGEYNDSVISCAEGLGLYTIQWDVDSLDWKDLSATAICERVIKRAKSGSIILCHNNGLHTAESLDMIFSTLISCGYEFVPISQLIYTGENQIDYHIDSRGEQHLKDSRA